MQHCFLKRLIRPTKKLDKPNRTAQCTRYWQELPHSKDRDKADRIADKEIRNFPKAYAHLIYKLKYKLFCN